MCPCVWVRLLQLTMLMIALSVYTDQHVCVTGSRFVHKLLSNVPTVNACTINQMSRSKPEGFSNTSTFV